MESAQLQSHTDQHLDNECIFIQYLSEVLEKRPSTVFKSFIQPMILLLTFLADCSTPTAVTTDLSFTIKWVCVLYVYILYFIYHLSVKQPD